jgi:hypothetical protein
LIDANRYSDLDVEQSIELLSERIRFIARCQIGLGVVLVKTCETGQLDEAFSAVGRAYEETGNGSPFSVFNWWPNGEDSINISETVIEKFRFATD